MSYKTKEKRNEWMKNYYKTHPDVYEKHKARMRKRKRVYEKFKKDRCERCSATIKLLVHHSNRNRQDNQPANLITLCRKCHLVEHKNDLQNIFYRGKEVKKE